MANPAALLHATLSNWRVGGRLYADTTDQRIAVRHLDAIEDLLDQMDAVNIGTEVYREQFPKWCALTLHNPNEWQVQSNLKHIDNTALDHLWNLSEWFRTLVPTVSTDGLDALRTFAEGTQTVLDEDDTIDPC